MKVWVAFRGEYNERRVIGVYANKADAVAETMPDALEWRETLNRMYPDNQWKPVSEADCDIEEHEVEGFASPRSDDPAPPAFMNPIVFPIEPTLVVTGSAAGAAATTIRSDSTSR